MTRARGDIDSLGHHPDGPSGDRGDAAQGSEGERPPVRAVLVGRTGMDQRLRREPGVELVRVRDALEAIGELGEPHGATGAVVVLVGPDSEPRETAEALGQWVGALRRVDPGVHVLRIATDRDQGPGEAYDGLVDPAGPIEQVLGWVNGRSRPAPRSSVAAAPVDDGGGPIGEPAPEPDPWDPGSAVEVGDTTVLEAMIQGRDPLDPAMELIRRRCGASVEFVPDPRDRSSCAGGDAVPVQWRGKRYGWLRGTAANDRASLQGHAAWLAGWIRLGAQQRELRLGAFSDPLTGAWNRRYFDRYLRSAIERAAARRGSVTVMVFDIDDFKLYNDRYGHAAGDEILVETVRLLGSLVRPSDRVCRVGGDEFAVVFDDPGGPREPGSRPPATIWQISKRFQDEICRHHFPKLGTEAPGTLTISGGLATYPWDGRTSEELVEHADALAIQSKQTGKNAITFGPGASRVCGTDPDIEQETDPDAHDCG